MIFYRDVCPYGKLKIPQQLSDEMDERWAYIPQGTKRAAQQYLDEIDTNRIRTFCAWADERAEKDYPGGNPYYINREQVPEFGVKVVKSWIASSNQYTVLTVVYNKTNQEHASTEWTCTLSNKGVKVYEGKIKVDDVKANSRVITKHQILYNGNATKVDCS